VVIELSADEREELEELTGWSNSRTLPAGDVFKADFGAGRCKGYSTVEAELGLRDRRLRAGRLGLKRAGSRDSKAGTEAASIAGRLPQCRRAF